MNCFEWQNRASDYLDGALIGPLKSEADAHVDSCKECSSHYQHYREILTQIASQPRSSIPIPIRKASLGRRIFSNEQLRLRRLRWERLPWYVRTSLEGVGIVLMILLGISAGPKLRMIYERGMEANLEELTQSYRDWRDSIDKTDRAAPLARGKVLGETDTPLAQGMPAGSEDFSSGDADSDTDTSEEESTDLVDGDIHVGSSEIWRFMLKTDNPREIRPKIVKILTDLKIPSNTPGLGGIEAPGGIQFDLLIPQSEVAPLKRAIQAIAPKAPDELAQTPAGETFTWYKNKSKRKLPEQQARVVIWLSQM